MSYRSRDSSIPNHTQVIPFLAGHQIGIAVPVEIEQLDAVEFHALGAADGAPVRSEGAQQDTTSFFLRILAGDEPAPVLSPSRSAKATALTDPKRSCGRGSSSACSSRAPSDQACGNRRGMWWLYRSDEVGLFVPVDIGEVEKHHLFPRRGNALRRGDRRGLVEQGRDRDPAALALAVGINEEVPLYRLEPLQRHDPTRPGEASGVPLREIARRWPSRIAKPGQGPCLAF